MKENIKSFLDSGLLERYLVGDTSIAENLEVENKIDNNPEIAEAYDKLQTNLEIVAKANAVEAPLGVLNKILLDTREESKVIVMPRQKTPWYSIAASVAAVAFGMWSVFLYQENKALNSENNVVVDEIFDLRDDIQNNNSKLDALAIQLQKLNDPDAQKYLLEGDRNLKTVAYINPIEKTSMIDVVSLPKLSENQQYQLRAELEDRMVSLGYLEDYQRELKPIPYMEEAVALNIVIEDKSENANNKFTEVAEISLKKK
ncbi:RNA polymerase subunit sigma-70 [Winogradskyella litorisediminis]|uniref:RNA polymerase subunit sigma-70 n=1 Tax=Winogradskyella litorisediminis TaxID=1156618 RepID=A0ABW3N6F7_9FLAO